MDRVRLLPLYRCAHRRFARAFQPCGLRDLLAVYDLAGGDDRNQQIAAVVASDAGAVSHSADSDRVLAAQLVSRAASGTFATELGGVGSAHSFGLGPAPFH